MSIYALIGIYFVYASIPTKEQARASLKDLFSEQKLDKICAIQTNKGGYAEWCSTFSTIQNSNLPLKQKRNAYINLITIAIAQTSPEDIELNERIQYRLEGMKRFENKGFRSEICTFDDLKTEFKARSNPSTSATSDEDGSPQKKRARTE